MSDILDFYQCRGADDAGRTFYDVIRAGDDSWEKWHGHVQWMYPLPEPSRAQPRSPVATQDDYNEIATSPVLKMRMLAALGRYISFLDCTTQWRLPMDHNHLRITRVIRCLCLSGLNDAAFEFCEYVKDQVGATVGKKTVWFWDEALKRHPAWLPAIVPTMASEIEKVLRQFEGIGNVDCWKPAFPGVSLWGNDLSAVIAAMSNEEVMVACAQYPDDGIISTLSGCGWEVDSPLGVVKGTATSPLEAGRMASRVALILGVAASQGLSRVAS